MYLITVPAIIRSVYHHCIWQVNTKDKIIYLTFDDGPHPEATPYVLDRLREYHAKATFFCIGKNVVEHPEIYRQILDEGHRVGNHTHRHVNGWKTNDQLYFDDIMEAAKHIDSNLFRPPYGKISRFQSKLLSGVKAYAHSDKEFRIIMWSVLSGDFDIKIDAKQTALNVIRNAGPGSIVVFHDSEKAYPRMAVALVNVLQHFSERGFRFESIPF